MVAVRDSGGENRVSSSYAQIIFLSSVNSQMWRLIRASGSSLALTLIFVGWEKELTT